MTDLENLFDSHTHHFTGKYREIVQLTALSGEELPPLFSFGIHPEESRTEQSGLEKIVHQLSANPGFLAIGEIGLDTRYDTKAQQEALYIFQLELATRYHKPVILHCVNSWDRCRFLHEKHAPETPLIYHGFNKSSIVKRVLEYPKSIISIGESILTNPALRKAVEEIPLHRLLLETDMGEEDLIDTYRAVAEIKSVSLHPLIDSLNQNAKRIFNYE